MIHYTDPNRFVKNEIASDKEESVTKSDWKAVATVARPSLFQEVNHAIPSIQKFSRVTGGYVRTCTDAVSLVNTSKSFIPNFSNEQTVF